MKVVWLESALEDQDAILEYVTEHDEAAAARLQREFDACANRLLNYPLMYPAGRAAGTREALAHPNYILIYRVEGEAVEIVRLVHSRQQYP